MIFPSKEEIEFFGQPEAREFFGARWEPSLGDFLALPEGGYDVAGLELLVILAYDRTQTTWLPRPDQLIEMLEEKVALGDLWFELRGPTFSEDCRYILDIDTGVPEEKRQYIGPTPAIALALALMEIG